MDSQHKEQLLLLNYTDGFSTLNAQRSVFYVTLIYASGNEANYEHIKYWGVPTPPSLLSPSSPSLQKRDRNIYVPIEKCYQAWKLKC